MFSLKCASEQFQHILENQLRDLPGVFNYVDDILVFGSDQEGHDQNLEAVLNRLQKLGYS